jgi:hypothetical protein
MAGASRRRLTKAEVEGFLARLRNEVARPECWSCECVQGFLAQLELDAAEDAKPLLAGHRTAPAETHRCLGCEPCPPADVFAEYLMRKRRQ